MAKRFIPIAALAAFVASANACQPVESSFSEAQVAAFELVVHGDPEDGDFVLETVKEHGTGNVIDLSTTPLAFSTPEVTTTDENDDYSNYIQTEFVLRVTTAEMTDAAKDEIKAKFIAMKGTKNPDQYVFNFVEDALYKIDELETTSGTGVNVQYWDVCAPGCTNNMLGDGYADDACNVEACGNDCEDFTAKEWEVCALSADEDPTCACKGGMARMGHIVTDSDPVEWTWSDEVAVSVDEESIQCGTARFDDVTPGVEKTCECKLDVNTRPVETDAPTPSPTSSPTLSPTPEEVTPAPRQFDCLRDDNRWTSRWGKCDSYAKGQPNHDYCEIDNAFDKEDGSGPCCLACGECQDDLSWVGRYGHCGSYAAGQQNHGFCSEDGAHEHCCRTCKAEKDFVKRCDNTCHWPRDGICDDGGEGSTLDLCPLGTDCDDCGDRSMHKCEDDHTWNMGYGNCDTYAKGESNHAYCQEDAAHQNCCHSCTDSPWETDRRTSKPGQERCEDHLDFRGQYGPCSSYMPGQANFGFCQTDMVVEQCCQTCRGQQGQPVPQTTQQPQQGCYDDPQFENHHGKCADYAPITPEGLVSNHHQHCVEDGVSQICSCACAPGQQNPQQQLLQQQQQQQGPN